MLNFCNLCHRRLFSTTTPVLNPKRRHDIFKRTANVIRDTASGSTEDVLVPSWQRPKPEGPARSSFVSQRRQMRTNKGTLYGEYEAHGEAAPIAPASTRFRPLKEYSSDRNSASELINSSRKGPGGGPGVSEHSEPPRDNADAAPWSPKKKLSFAAMDGLRALYKADPVSFNKNVLAKRFGISHEAVSRILRGRFTR